MSILEHDDTTKTSDNSPFIQNKKSKKEDLLRKSDFISISKKEQNLIEIINQILMEITEDNKKDMMKNKNINYPKTVFFMKNLPNINFLEYLKRIQKYLKPENSTFVIALIYVDKICSEKSNKILMIENNIFKLFLTATILAIKYNEDFYDDNAYFAKVGGINLNEMNILENEFLDLLNFKLFVSDEIFNKYNNNLINYIE